MLLGNTRGLVGVHQQPAVLQATVVRGAGIGPMLPGIISLKSLLAQIAVIARAGPVVGMQAVVALIGFEAAFRHMHADHRIRRDPQRLQAFDIRRHMGLADQHVAHADLLQVVAERGLADPQRPAVPVRTMRAHVAAGIERHPRRAADRRLHVGFREAHAAPCHRVDIRRFQCRVARATKIIMAKLIAHDPEDVLRLRHVLLRSQDGGRPMLQYRRDDCKPLAANSALRRRRRGPGLGLCRAALGLQRDRGFADHLDQRPQRVRHAFASHGRDQ